MSVDIGAHQAGQRHYVTLPAGEVELPMILIRGAHPGPVMAVTAAVHGDEFEGVHAIFEAVDAIDPTEMSGTLIAVPVSNPPAFWNVTRTSPLDGANLARVFPGRPDGSPSDRIADALARHVIAQADFFADLHSGGVRCVMPLLAGYDASDPRGEAAAIAFGAPAIWAHDTIPPGRTVSIARDLGIPWIYAESPGGGRIDSASARVYRQGILRLLAHWGLRHPPPEPRPPEVRLYGDGNIDESVTASQPGFLRPRAQLLDRVRAGDTLGHLLDLHGRELTRLTAPRSGRVVLIHACPIVHPGDPLFLVTGEVQRP